MHYTDVIMSAMVSQITSLTIVYSTVYSGADQRKHHSSASLASVRVIHRWSVNSPHKGPVMRIMFLFDDVIISVPIGRVNGYASVMQNVLWWRHGNVFRIIGHLWGKSHGGSIMQSFDVLSVVSLKKLLNNHIAGDLWRHEGHATSCYSNGSLATM